MVRMSFCAAQRKSTACAGAAASAATVAAASKNRLRLIGISPWGRGLVDPRVARLRAVVGLVDRLDVLLHRPGPQLVVQRHVVVLVPGDGERLADHAVALLGVGL